MQPCTFETAPLPLVGPTIVRGLFSPGRSSSELSRPPFQLCRRPPGRDCLPVFPPSPSPPPSLRESCLRPHPCYLASSCFLFFVATREATGPLLAPTRVTPAPPAESDHHQKDDQPGFHVP